MSFQPTSETENRENYLDDGAIEQRKCDTHGAFDATFHRPRFGGVHPFWTQCPTCTDERLRAEREQRDARKRADAEADRVLHVRSMKRLAAIPARYADKGFDDFVPTTPKSRTALAVARKFAETIAAGTAPKGASLLLIGRPGTGKTHLAAAISHAITDSGRGVRYTTVSDLSRRIRATYGRDVEEREDEIFEEMTRTQLLIVDELGAGVPSEHERKIVFEVIDTRYRELRPVVLISNLPLEELARVMGERVVDRLREMATTVAFDWKSHRG
jgi:DNA replication protein DnaC